LRCCFVRRLRRASAFLRVAAAARSRSARSTARRLRAAIADPDCDSFGRLGVGFAGCLRLTVATAGSLRGDFLSVAFVFGADLGTGFALAFGGALRLVARVVGLVAFFGTLVGAARFLLRLVTWC
jgi:hypothetical protein